MFHCSLKCVSKTVPLTPEYTSESKLPGARGRKPFFSLFKKIHPSPGKLKASPLIRLRKSPGLLDFRGVEKEEEKRDKEVEVKEEVKKEEEVVKEPKKATRSDLALMRLQFFGMATESAETVATTKKGTNSTTTTTPITTTMTSIPSTAKSQIPKLKNQSIANPAKALNNSSRIPVKTIKTNITTSTKSLVKKPPAPAPFYTQFLYKPKSLVNSISSSSSSVYLDDEISDHCFLVGELSEFVEPTKEEISSHLNLLEEVCSLKESLLLLKEMLKMQEEREKGKDLLIQLLRNK